MTSGKLSTVLICVLSLAVSGCGKAAKKVPVSGKVTIDGKPVTEAGYVLNFSCSSGSAAIEVGADGSFSGEAYEGKNTVQLTNEKKGHEAMASAKSGKSASKAAESAYGSSFASTNADVSGGASLTLDFKKSTGGGTSGGH